MKQRKSKTVEVILIMAAFGIAAIANALSRGNVQNEVAASIAAAKAANPPVVSVYDLP